MPTIAALSLLLALFLGVGWWLQARRDRRRLRERTRSVVKVFVDDIATHYSKQKEKPLWQPFVARWLADLMHMRALWPKAKGYPADIYVAVLEALVEAFELTFDGERFHAQGPPRKPKEETNDS